jgi:pyridoxal phosphate enzyme (YggS family)
MATCAHTSTLKPVPHNSKIGDRLQQVREVITEAERRYHREPGAVTLLAVSKGQGIEHLREAIDAGQRRFGESYLQEARGKMDRLANEPLEWHFIGPIQANKTRPIAQHFDWVHSVDRLKVAQRLSQQRPAQLPPLNICLQVNISQEPTKAGVGLARLAELAERSATLPRLKLRGLMAIPRAQQDFELQRRGFAALRLALEGLNRHGFGLDTLSMGMSQDMTAAVAEGATLVRIGTAVFGPRPTSGDNPLH